MNNIWCEVYLSKLKSNLDKIKEIDSNKKVIAVVKANAYGLGLKDVSNFLSEDVDLFAVSNLTESSIIEDKDVLILSPLCDKYCFMNEKENIICTIDNEEILDTLDVNTKKRVHLYVDTGMSRQGINPSNVNNVIEKITSKFPYIKIEGIYSHLHNTSNVEYTKNQISVFENVVKNVSIEIPYIHLMASSSFIKSTYRNLSEFTNTIRIGNLMFGHVGQNIGFEKVFKFKVRPISIYNVSKGSQIGYNCTYSAKDDMKAAIIDGGNFHGIDVSRMSSLGLAKDIAKAVKNNISKSSPFYYNGQPVSILGKVGMNTIVVDAAILKEGLDSVLDLNISPILSDSSITKQYIK